MTTANSNPIRHIVEPRDVPAAKAARRMHLTVKEFAACLSGLLKRGFPGADETTGHYDLRAIDAWMDRRSGLASGAPVADNRNDGSLAG